MPTDVVCQGCGLYIEGEPACADCHHCDECMPGDCWECCELRREDLADQARRYAIENEVCS